MSLTGQLRDGMLAAGCASTLTGTTAVAAELATRAATGPAAGWPPVRPHHIGDPGHWATVGGAFGQRLAPAAQHAPPYYALLGAHRTGLTDAVGVQRAAAAFPTHADHEGYSDQLRSPSGCARPAPTTAIPTCDALRAVLSGVVAVRRSDHEGVAGQRR